MHSETLKVTTLDHARIVLVVIRKQMCEGVILEKEIAETRMGLGKM